MDYIPGLLRWFHIMSGVMWIGLLYYFNFVQVQALKAAGADGTAAGITKHVAPRALFWFRWAALATWLFGLGLLGPNVINAFTFQNGFAAIGVGAWLGTIMFLNVWGVIWQHQKKILNLGAYAANPASDEVKAKSRIIAAFASRVNVLLSVPMFFFMIAGSSAHMGLFF
jgi:uncharacterized membrane protein